MRRQRKRLQPGSPLFNEVFETAARVYPDDPAANLNAANAAIAARSYFNAAAYLAKAGNSPEAEYARAVLAALTGDYAKSAADLDRAVKAGYKGTDDDVAKLREFIDAASNSF